MQVPHFFQSENWFNFWEQLNIPKYKNHHLSTGKLSARIRQIPKKYGKSYFYIPKGPSLLCELSSGEFKTEFQKLIALIQELSKKNNINIIRFEFTPEIIRLNKYNLNNLLEIDSRLKKTSEKGQYKQSAILDLSSVVPNPLNTEISDSNLIEFYKENQKFWNGTSQSTQENTKRSLSQKWLISTAKTQENFENFWKVYKKTTPNLKPSSEVKTYFKVLFSQSFTKIIILKGEKNQPQVAWLGANIDGTIINLQSLYTKKALELNGHYLIMLTAIFQESQNNILKFDFAGINQSNPNYSFIKGYNPEIVHYGIGYELVFNSFGSKILSVIEKIKGGFSKK